MWRETGSFTRSFDIHDIQEGHGTDWIAELDISNANLTKLRQLQPDTAKGFTALHRGAMQEGALGVKEKELIALSIGIAKQCVDCIGFHIKAAIRAGATRDEVAETISVAIMMGGGPSFMYGAKALEAFDQLSG